MKNLTFEFSDYDRVFNLNCHTVLLLKSKSSYIESKLIIFDKDEKTYLFTLDNSCILDTLNVIYYKNKLFFVWENTEANIIFSIYRVENDNIYNKNQLIVSYDCNKTNRNPLINYENNKLIIFWLESNSYNTDYSKFEIKKNIYEIDESLDDIYINLLDSTTIIENIDIDISSNIYSSELIIEQDYCFIYSYKNKFNKYKILFMDLNTSNSIYINSNDSSIKSISLFNLRNKIYIFWINNNENIYGRIIEKRKNEYVLEKEFIKSLENSFSFFYQKNLCHEINNNKLIKLPLKLSTNDLIELFIYSTGKYSFIIIFDAKHDAKMRIKFETNNLVSLDNNSLFNNSDMVTISLTTDIYTNYIIFFKYIIDNNYLVCYQNREVKSEYNISKIEEIIIELNKGINKVNDMLIDYDKKNIAIYKLLGI